MGANDSMPEVPDEVLAVQCPICPPIGELTSYKEGGGQPNIHKYYQNGTPEYLFFRDAFEFSDDCNDVKEKLEKFLREAANNVNGRINWHNVFPEVSSYTKGMEATKNLIRMAEMCAVNKGNPKKLRDDLEKLLAKAKDVLMERERLKNEYAKQGKSDQTHDGAIMMWQIMVQFLIDLIKSVVVSPHDEL